MHRVILDKIIKVYRFAIHAPSWERDMNDSSHFLAYKLHGLSMHESGGALLPFGKDTLMVANRTDYYRVLHHEMENEGVKGSCIAVHFTTIEPFDLHLAVYQCADQPQIRSAFFRLLDAWNRYQAANRPAEAYACVSCFYEILSRLFLLADPAAAQGGDKLAQARDYLMRNYADNTLIIAEAARCAGLGQRRFGELFQARYGQTPGRCLTECRIAAAAKLLRQEKLSVSNVASLTGFTSASYFIRVFKREMGVSPKMYSMREENG